MKMKKALAFLAAMTMMLGMASCGGNENSTPSSTTGAAETTAATTAADETTTASAETTAAPVTTAEAAATTAADTPYANHKEMKLQNDEFGFTASFLLPPFTKLDEKQNIRKPSETAFNYKAYYSEKEYVDIDVCISIMNTNSLEGFKKSAQPLPNTKYDGYIDKSSKEYSWNMHFYGDTYLDGAQYCNVSVIDRSKKMPEADFKALLEEIQKTFTFTDLGANKLYGADGTLINTQAWFSYPTEITIDGVAGKPEFKASTRDAHIRMEITDSKGQKVKLGEAGSYSSSAWKSFMDSNAKKSPFDCKIAGFDAKGYMFQEQKTLHAIFAVQIGEDQFMQLFADWYGDMEIGDLKAALEGSGLDDLRKKMTAYVNDFLSAATKLDSSAAAVTTAASGNSGAITTAADNSKTVTTAAATTADEKKKMTETQPAGQGMSDEALLSQLKMYHASKYNHQPEFAEITDTNGNEVTVRLYDMRGTDKKILNELTVDRVTGKGTQLFDGASFQLADNQSPNEPLWEPTADVYQLVPDGKAAAVIYLGTYKHPTETIDVENVVKYYAEHSDAAKKYKFIKDIPEQNIIWTDNGTELWVIIPKNPASTITVWENSSETHTTKHRLTETYNGAPIIVFCNYSDIAPDVSVQINPIGGTPNAPFAPCISMKDGNPTTTDEENITILN